MAHRVQINQDQTVLDDIPYSEGDIAELDDESFNAIPPGMFTSGKLTNLGETGGGGAGAFDPTGLVVMTQWSGQINNNAAIADDAELANYSLDLGGIQFEDIEGNDPLEAEDAFPEDWPATPIDLDSYRFTQFDVRFLDTGVYLVNFSFDFGAGATGRRVVKMFTGLRAFDGFGNFLLWINEHPTATRDRICGQFVAPVGASDIVGQNEAAVIFILGQNSGANPIVSGTATFRKVG